MANKSFVVQYLIKARDQYTKVAKNVSKSTAEMTARIDNAKKSMTAFAAKSAKTGAILTASVTAPVTLAARAMISAASDAQETSDKFDMVFEAMGKKAPEAATRLAAKYKLANSTSKEMLSTTGAILSASGLSTKRILEMSEVLNGASIDLASFHNFQGDASEASLIMTKALLGEAESLKTNFGITILQNKAFQDAVKAKMQLTGVTQQAAKAEVIFAEVMSQMKAQKAVDNFNITLDSYANQQRVAEEATKRMRETWGKLLLPMATKLQQNLAKVAEYLSNLSPASKKAIIVVAGLAAVLGPVALGIAGIVGVIPYLLTGLAVLTGPIGLIVTGITALGVAIYTNWDKIVAWTTRFKESLLRQIQPLIDIFDKVKSAMSSAADLLPSFGNQEATLRTRSERLRTAPLKINPTSISQTNSSSMAVDVNVGLDKGLKETNRSTRMRGVRRSDIGMVPAR